MSRASDFKAEHGGNRAARRHTYARTYTGPDGRALSATPLPGSEPVTVSRSVPVSMIAGADGAREVVDLETAKACLTCKCCAVWHYGLDQLRAAMVTHYQDDHQWIARDTAGRAGAFPECVVCQLMAGAADA